MTKTKLIGILLGLTIFLLIVNSIIEVFNKEEIVEPVPGYSVAEAENILFETTNAYGIQPEWMKILKKKFPGQDSLSHIIKIEIPADLPLPILIDELKTSYPDTLLLDVTETEKHGNSIIKLFNHKIQLLELYLNYNKDIVRPFCQLAFIMAPVESIDEQMMTEIIRNPNAFSMSFIPSFESEKEISKLKGLDKNYVVLLNDEIPDNKFKLGSVTDRNRLKGAVEGIITSFGVNTTYFLDDKSSIYNSTSYNFIKDEFAANNISLNRLSKLVNFTQKERDDIESLLKFYCSSAPADTTISMLINIEDFLSMKDVISVYKKKGHKICLFNE